MNEGLTMFFACLIAALIIILFTCILFQYNPIWVIYQLKGLEVGEVRWEKGSIKKGPLHRVAIVKEINKKKRKIVYDRYTIQPSGKYKLEASNITNSYGNFFRLTLPEPVYKETILNNTESDESK